MAFYRSRQAVIMAAIAASLALSCCDSKKSQTQNTPTVQAQSGASAGAPVVDDDAPAVTAALAAPQFVRPIMLHLSHDSFAAARYAATLNGEEPVPTPLPNGGGSMVVGVNLSPCWDTTDTMNHPDTSLDASIETYPINHAVIVQWLVNKGVVEREEYPIKFTQPSDPLYGQQRTFICWVISDDVRKYLPAAIAQSVDIHQGFDIPLLSRTFVAWTYRNRYNTTISGMGTVKVFAGTFTYRLDSVIPGASATALGSASVKVFLNPDNGHWQLDTIQLHDPALSLQ